MPVQALKKIPDEVLCTTKTRGLQSGLTIVYSAAIALVETDTDEHDDRLFQRRMLAFAQALELYGLEYHRWLDRQRKRASRGNR